MNVLPTGAADEPRHKPKVSFNPRTGLFGRVATARLALMQAGLRRKATEMARRAYDAPTLDEAMAVVLEYVDADPDPAGASTPARHDRRRRVAREKVRAELMRFTTDGLDNAYWYSYRMGLAARSEHHDQLMAMVGSPDADADARARGYRDGRAFLNEMEVRT